jgi:hypothetical protein
MHEGETIEKRRRPRRREGRSGRERERKAGSEDYRRIGRDR